MFVLNGIVYANEKSENIQVVSVKPLDDMMMILTFSTGEQRLFDASILTGSVKLRSNHHYNYADACQCSFSDKRTNYAM